MTSNSKIKAALHPNSALKMSSNCGSTSSVGEIFISGKNSTHLRRISASREVTGTNTSKRYGMAVTPSKYVKVRYNGNAYGGFHMPDSDFPRESNLNDRKQ